MAYEELTPFAQALQDWMWYENRPPMTKRVEFARRAGLPRSTVDSWFLTGAMPKGANWHAVLRVTGWPEAKLLALTGYDAPPPYAPDTWQFIAEELDQTDEFRAPEKERFRAWLDDLKHRADALVAGGGTRSAPRQDEPSALLRSTRDDITDAEASVILERMKHEERRSAKAHSGK